MKQKIYLAVNYLDEGWKILECESPEQALDEVKSGETYGLEWKILKELEVKVEEEL